ncbi:MAG: hypothetical protein ABH816_01610 [Candidatus Levyibacteriota bacterium]
MYIFFGLITLWVIFDISRGYRKASNKRKYLVKTFSVAGIITLIFFLFGPFFMISPIKLGYSTLSDDSITLYYPSSHTTRAEEIFTMAKQATEKNDAFYQASTHTKILIATSDLDMLRFGVYPQGNGGGLIWGIVIRESKASWNIIAHEMSHKNLSKLSPLGSSVFSFPRWFDEGIASYIGDMNYYKTLPELKEDLLSGLYRRDITTWRGISGMFTWLKFTFIKPNPRLIYGQTFLMTKFLADTYGENRINQLVQAVGQRTSFETAFLQVFGISADEYHQQFIDFLQKS